MSEVKARFRGSPQIEKYKDRAKFIKDWIEWCDERKLWYKQNPIGDIDKTKIKVK